MKKFSFSINQAILFTTFASGIAMTSSAQELALKEVPLAPVKKTILKEVSCSEMVDDAKIHLAFVGNSIQSQATLPSACVENLYMETKKTSTSSDLTAEATSADNVKDSANKYEVSFKYKASAEKDAKDLSLGECLKNHEGEDLVNLQDVAQFNKEILKDGEVAIAGFHDFSEDFVMSEEGLKIKAQYAKAEKLNDKKGFCVDCAKKDIASLAKKDITFVKTLFTKLFDSSLNDAESRVQDAKSIAKLDAIHGDLVDFDALISSTKLSDSEKEAFHGKVQVVLGEILAKNHDLAVAGTIKSSASADFMKKVISTTVDLGLDEDVKDQAKETIARLGKGGSARLEYLLQVDPNNKEIATAFKDTQVQEKKLDSKARWACMYGMNKRCYNAQQEIATFKKENPIFYPQEQTPFGQQNQVAGNASNSLYSNPFITSLQGGQNVSGYQPITNVNAQNPQNQSAAQPLFSYTHSSVMPTQPLFNEYSTPVAVPLNNDLYNVSRQYQAPNYYPQYNRAQGSNYYTAPVNG